MFVEIADKFIILYFERLQWAYLTRNIIITFETSIDVQSNGDVTRNLIKNI